MDTPTIDPRGDLSGVNPLEVDMHIACIQEILAEDVDDIEMAANLRRYVGTFLNPQPELWIAVNDELPKRGILTKKQIKDFLSLNLLADIPW